MLLICKYLILMLCPDNTKSCSKNRKLKDLWQKKVKFNTMVANIANVEKAVNLKVTRRLALNTQDVAKMFKAATIQTLATFKRWLK